MGKHAGNVPDSTRENGRLPICRASDPPDHAHYYSPSRVCLRDALRCHSARNDRYDLPKASLGKVQDYFPLPLPDRSHDVQGLRRGQPPVMGGPGSVPLSRFPATSEVFFKGMGGISTSRSGFHLRDVHLPGGGDEPGCLT